MKGFLMGLIVGGIIAWDCATYTAADECDKVGAFFYGERIYSCSKRN
ncbi:hypothetical protein [Acinetobacter colistiniresistens]|nr:hypothetical protein [Acinetobacter colistiniresistens]